MPEVLSNAELPPSVDVTAPDGRPIVLRPVVSLERMADLRPAVVAAVLCLCLIFLATSFSRLNHTDLWGHLCFGRWIARHGQLPTADPFRSFAAGEPFLNVPWLSQLLGYGVHQLGGLEGLVLAHALLASLTAAALLWAVRQRGVALGWAVVAAAASYVLALPVTGTIRPQLFGTLGFALTLGAIARLPRRGDPLGWLPLLFALWANLHGSFLLGLAALGCFALAAVWEVRGWRWQNPRRRRQLGRALAALGLATAGACLNPCGPRLLLLVGQFGENTSLTEISEWRPLTLMSFSGGLCLASLLGIAVLLRWSRRRITASEILLSLLFLVACLSALRMLAWWALLWPWIVAPHLADLGQQLRQRMPRPPVLTATGGLPRWLLGTLVAIALTVWWAPPTHALLTLRPRPDVAILSSGTPTGVAEAAVRLGLRGRCFAPIDWADYLIWRTDGALEPLIYSHVHLSGPAVWRDFLTLREGSDGWLRIAAARQLGYLFIPRLGYHALHTALSASFLNTPDYLDSQGEIFALPSTDATQAASPSRQKR